ncbi:MAG: head decoration protein [Chromatiales bacterium]|nr:head decoration protein [Chromatiales bacterium]
MSILASSESQDLSPVTPLFAGSAPITTNRAAGGANVNLAAGTVIALVNDLIVAHDADAVNGSEVAVGILTEALNTVAQPGSWAAYYTGGDFNHEALVWDAALNTLALRRAAFAQTDTIKISAVK